MSLVRFRPEAPTTAGVAHPVERHLAKVEVASSSLVARSINQERTHAFLISIWYCSQVVRPRSAKPLFASSNLASTSKRKKGIRVDVLFLLENRTGRFEPLNATVRGLLLVASSMAPTQYFSFPLERKIPTNLASADKRSSKPDINIKRTHTFRCAFSFWRNQGRTDLKNLLRSE